ncbi:MAG: ABC transporter ATP-binding protein [Deltaproteobacteria bacterium]|nr:ABC transporter ATP-binding protein [Deltaproteobacteria bacterium]
MIHLHNINKSYHLGSGDNASTMHVLKDVSMSVETGEMVSIMGSSGSGKSTLLNILGLLDAFDSGEYTLAGENMSNLSQTHAAGLRNRHIGFVFQSFNLLPFKTALENVALPLYYQGIPRKKRLQIAKDNLEQVGLGPWEAHRPTQLSGGQQQRVAIARALAAKPNILLADEPTGALDTETSYQVMDLLTGLNRDGLTIVVVTHESDIAAMTQRTVRLKDGKVVPDTATAPREPMPTAAS